MDETTALTSIKNRVSIVTTDFDVQLKDFYRAAVKRLYPMAQKEIAPQTVSVSVDTYGEAVVDLSSISLTDVRAVEASNGGAWYTIDSIFRHGTQLRVRDLDTSVTQLRLYGLQRFVVDGSGVVALPDELEEPVLWFMASAFFDMLAGNKSKYNLYMQSAGGNAVDDMRAEADYYEQRALDYLERKTQIYGA